MSPLLGHRQTDGQPLFSPFSSKEVAAGAQAVNRSSGKLIGYLYAHLDANQSPPLNYVVAALAFLVWDILITTDDEVRMLSALVINIS